MSEDESFESRGIILSVHRCAYCGSKNTKALNDFDFRQNTVRFAIGCNDCEKIDMPSVLHSELNSFLMGRG